MKIEIVNHSDMIGGAARAAFRLHRALVSAGEESVMRVAEKCSDDWRVLQSNPTSRSRIQARLKSLSDRIMGAQESDNLTLHSASAFFASHIDLELNASDSEVINLHWVCGNMLSVEDIGRIQKPVVWTMHDMWPFCGAEHYAEDSPGARFEVGYTKFNKPLGNRGLDIDRWVWNRKCKSWRRPMHIVTPSRWLADCARRSLLMKDWPVSVIPNPLNMRVYKPWPKGFARQTFDLPDDKRLIAFGAIGGVSDQRKGFDMLLATLRLMAASRKKNLACVVFGQSRPEFPPDIGMPIYWMGHLNDDVSLALLYSAIDVMVVPSRQENLPQSGTEAQACGCPVVAFNCTGLPDVVEHRLTGYLANAYSVEDMANGIQWVLEDSVRHAELSAASRSRAVRLWSEEVVVPQYQKVYKEISNSAVFM